MHRLAEMQYRFVLAPLEQTTLEIEHILHRRCYLIALRQRSTQQRVCIRIAVSRHRILIAVQHLRNTAHRSKQHVSQLHATRVFVLDNIRDTRHVVVAKECQQLIHIGVHIVHRHGVIHARQTVTPTAAVILQCLTNRLFYREVHHGRQVRIEAVEVLRAALPISHCRSWTSPAFAYDIEVRILFANSLEPLTAGYLLNIRIRVHTKTVQVCIFNPPDRPLLEVFEQVGVLQIHIRHRLVEPSAVA